MKSKKGRIKAILLDYYILVCVLILIIVSLSNGWFYSSIRHTDIGDEKDYYNIHHHYGLFYYTSFSIRLEDNADVDFDDIPIFHKYYQPFHTLIFKIILVVEIINLILLGAIHFTRHKKEIFLQKRYVKNIATLSLLLPIIIIIIGIPFSWQSTFLKNYEIENSPLSFAGYMNSTRFDATIIWLPSWCWAIQILIVIAFRMGIHYNTKRNTVSSNQKGK